MPVISIVMEYAECGDLNERIKKQREVEKTLFPEVRQHWKLNCLAGSIFAPFSLKIGWIHTDIKKLDKHLHTVWI